jgi:hypothetical protein
MNDLTPSTPSAVSKHTGPSPISIFGPPPLIDGEDAKAYDEMLLRVSSAEKPTDFLEEIWVRDVVDLTWEIHRWRQLKAHLISVGVTALVKSKLENVLKKNQEVHKLIALWIARDLSAIIRVKEYLALTGDTLESIAARAVLGRLGYFRSLEELTTKAESRRNGTLREIDRHRAVLAQRLREKVQEFENAKLKTIDQKVVSQLDSTVP